MLSELQRRKFTHQFRVMDEDHNGFLEWPDFQRIAAKIEAVTGVAPDETDRDSLIGQYAFAWEESKPFQERGGFTLERWLDYHDGLLRSAEAYDTVIRQTAEMIFDTFDLDDDKRVSSDEWRAFFRCYGIDEDHVVACFPLYDLDGDGYVTRGELIRLVGDFFLSDDPDAPGNLLFGPFD